MPTREKITRLLNNYRGIWADISRYTYREILMKYRINTAYYMSKSGIWLVISRVVSYFHEPKASANTAYK